MYQEIFNSHAKLLKAISHPKRLEIIHLLRDQKLSVGQIQQMLSLPQANLSQHLSVLKSAEVVNTDRQGKQIYYHLTHQNFIKASDLIREILIEKYKNKKEIDEFSYPMDKLVPLTSDPVCHMRLSPKTAAFVHQYHKHEHYFCASGCYEKFVNNPAKYCQTES